MMTGEFNKEAGQDMITAELTRIVARYDVKNADLDYTLESVSIWNAFPEQTIGDINFSDFTPARIRRLYGINEIQENKILGGLYSYENFVSSPEQNDDVSTCLILGIRNNESGNLGYYRVNANLQGRPQQIRRNNAYTFTVNSVKGTGENTEEDAYNSSKNELNVQVNEWNIDDQGCIVSLMGIIFWRWEQIMLSLINWAVTVTIKYLQPVKVHCPYPISVCHPELRLN